MPHNSNPKITISIVNLNKKELLKECLNSLFEHTIYDNFEVVVVDNASVDGSITMLKSEFPNTTVIQNDENQGFAKANNQVIEYAMEKASDYVLLLNNDTKIIETGWLSRLVEIGETEQDIGIVGCKVVEPSGKIHYGGRYFPLSSFLFPYHKGKFKYNIYENSNSYENFQYIDDVVGAVFLIKVDLIDDIGYLDEGFSPAYFEESDYCVRAWDENYKVAYCPEVVVQHHRHETADQFDEIWLEYIRHRNRLRFMLLNYPKSWVMYSLPFIFLLTLRMFVTRSNQGDFRLRSSTFSNPYKPVKYSILAYIYIFWNLREILSMRRQRENIRDLVK